MYVMKASLVNFGLVRSVSVTIFSVIGICALSGGFCGGTSNAIVYIIYNPQSVKPFKPLIRSVSPTAFVPDPLSLFPPLTSQRNSYTLSSWSLSLFTNSGNSSP